MEQNKKYNSVAKFINKIPDQSLQAARKHQFQKNIPEFNESSYIQSDLLSSRDQFIDKLQKKINIFCNDQFDFKFLESKFPDVPPGTSNTISYEQRMNVDNQDTFANRLSPEQVDQIRQNGQFQVHSNNSPTPYVWKINECLLKGAIGRKNIWEDGWAWCYSFIINAKEFFVYTIPESCKKIVRMPGYFFDLFFGKKRLRQIYSPNFVRQVQKDFWMDIMNNQLKQLNNQIGHQFLQSVYIYYDDFLYKQIEETDQQKQKQLSEQKNEKEAVYNKKKTVIQDLKASLCKVEDQFENNWTKIKKNLFNKLMSETKEYQQKSMVIQSDQQPLSTQITRRKDQTIIQKFQQQKYTLYVAHLKQNLPKINVVSQTAITCILNLITILNIIDFKNKTKSRRIQDSSTILKDQIKHNYSIRSRNQSFVVEKLKQLLDPIKQKIQIQTQDQIIEELQKLPFFNDRYKSMIRKYFKYVKQFDTLFQEKKSKSKALYVGDRVFESYYVLLPPYEVQKIGMYYGLKKKQNFQIDTSTHFWKCKLYAMRFKCWNLNCLKYFITLCWTSRLGLRGLFGIENYVYDESIDATTGTKIQKTRPTFLGIFCTVLDGIKKSRQQFEAKPDLGILGKNCSRFCNILQCYVFRFFIVGVIGVLMLFPVAIILFSILGFIGILTFWIWTPIVLIIVYFFNILVFQFQTANKMKQCIFRLFPLVSLFILLIYHVVKIIAAFLFLVLIAPFICFFYILFLVLQRGMRTFTDALVACFLGCCGRTPSVDTCMATRISGPGMSRGFFYSIAEQDVYILVQAALEKILMQKINTLTLIELQKFKTKYDKICSFIFKPFGVTNLQIKSQKDFVQLNRNSLIQDFTTKFYQYMKRYPNNPYSVRFSQQQIQIYFQNSIRIVKNFVEKNGIQDWIFEDRQTLHEDYEELTRKIWIQIFNQGEQIFQPLEKLDKRMKLVGESHTNSGIMRQNINAVFKTIKGEVDLSNKKVSFSPANRSLMDQDQSMRYLGNLFDIHTSNSLNCINVKIEDASCIFVPHRNLKELQQYDKYQYEMTRRTRREPVEE